MFGSPYLSTQYNHSKQYYRFFVHPTQWGHRQRLNQKKKGLVHYKQMLLLHF